MSKDKIDIQLIKETPPHNAEAEKTILGIILADSKKLEEILPIILPGDFYSEANRTIFSAMIALKHNDRPIDILTLNAVLEKAKLLKEVGRASYISSLMDGVPRSSNIKHYARMVKEASIYRQIIHVAAKAIASTYGQDGDPTHVIGELQTGLSGLESEARRIKAPTQSLSGYLREKQGIDSKRKIGQPLGCKLIKFFPQLTQNISGLQPGLYLIGAYTNRGKTALLTSLLLDVLFSNPGITVMYFSLDDNVDTIINRLLSTKTGVDINDVQREQVGEENPTKLREAYDYYVGLAKKRKMFIRDISDIRHVDNLEADIREKAGSKLVVFIDDIHNLNTGSGYNGLREENIDRANKIKNLAILHKIPIICTAELRKKAPGESVSRKPNENDLMESGKFAYNAQVVWILYPKGKDEEFKKESEPTLILDYAKNKFSAFNGFQELVFTKAQGKIKELGQSEFD